MKARLSRFHLSLPCSVISGLKAVMEAGVFLFRFLPRVLVSFKSLVLPILLIPAFKNALISNSAL